MPGPFLYQNQCAAFIELVFPLAVYQSLVDRRHSLVYMTIAAGMFATVIAAVSRAGVARLAAELLMVILLVAWRRGLMPALSLRKAVMRMAALSVVLAAVVGSALAGQQGILSPWRFAGYVRGLFPKKTREKHL